MEELRDAFFMSSTKREEKSGKEKSKRNSSPLSYVAVIANAILSSPLQRLPLCEIYRFIEECHPEFTENRVRWKNTVRHNLSLHDCFVRGELALNKKGCNWRIHPSFVAQFIRGDFSRHKLSQHPSRSWESRFHAPYGAHEAVNQASPCCMFEITCGHVIPSHGWLPFTQRQEMQHSPTRRVIWRPWVC